MEDNAGARALERVRAALLGVLRDAGLSPRAHPLHVTLCKAPRGDRSTRFEETAWGQLRGLQLGEVQVTQLQLCAGPQVARFKPAAAALADGYYAALETVALRAAEPAALGGVGGAAGLSPCPLPPLPAAGSGEVVVRVFDFDGTLFRSPVPSASWSPASQQLLRKSARHGGLGWFESPLSLQEPLVQGCTGQYEDLG